jgi:hypothetical protein
MIWSGWPGYTVVLLPLAATLPLRVAPVSLIPLAASVVATGGGGEAVNARLKLEPQVIAVNRAPVFTNTGTLLLVVVVLPNWP